MGIAAFEGRQLLVGDIPSAYLQAERVPADCKPVLLIADKYVTKLIVEAMPEYSQTSYSLTEPSYSKLKRQCTDYWSLLGYDTKSWRSICFNWATL